MYFYSTIGSEAKQAYNYIFDAIQNMVSKVSTAKFLKKKSFFSDIIKMIIYDNP